MVHRTRSNQVLLRLTDAENSKLRLYAKAAGMTLSGYILFKLGMDAGEALADKLLSRSDECAEPRTTDRTELAP